MKNLLNDHREAHAIYCFLYYGSTPKKLVKNSIFMF
jgi:hypothetical protein